MDGADIKFNAKLQMPVKIAQEQKPVLLEISDSLDAAEEKLRRPYKDKIAKFVDSSASWYPLAIEKIKEETPDPGKTRLLQIFFFRSRMPIRWCSDWSTGSTPMSNMAEG